MTFFVKITRKSNKEKVGKMQKLEESLDESINLYFQQNNSKIKKVSLLLFLRVLFTIYICIYAVLFTFETSPYAQYVSKFSNTAIIIIAIGGISAILLVVYWKYVNKEFISLASNYMGNMKIISKNTDDLNNLIINSKILKNADCIFTDKISVKYAFQVFENNFSYNLYFFEALRKPLIGGKNSTRTTYSGIAVVIQNRMEYSLPNFSDISQNFVSEDESISEIKFARNRYFFVSTISTPDLMPDINSFIKSTIQKWTKNNVKELIKIQQYVRNVLNIK